MPLIRPSQLRYPLLPRRPWRIAISAAAAAVMSLLFLRALRPPLVAAFASSGGGRSTDSSGAPGRMAVSRWRGAEGEASHTRGAATARAAAARVVAGSAAGGRTRPIPSRTWGLKRALTGSTGIVQASTCAYGPPIRPTWLAAAACRARAARASPAPLPGFPRAPPAQAPAGAFGPGVDKKKPRSAFGKERGGRSAVGSGWFGGGGVGDG